MYNIVFLLDSILGPHRRFANTEHYYFCPFCNHYNPKLAVNINKRAWHCWKCNARGSSLVGLLRKLNASREDITEMEQLVGERVSPTTAMPEEKLTALPVEFIPLWEPSSDFYTTAALKYLRSRNISTDDIAKYQLGFCSSGKYQHRIIIPSYDARGLLNYFVARDFFNTGALKYLNPPVSKNFIGFENQINWDYPILLVEGVFDAMAIKRNAIPLMGVHIPKKLKERIIKRQDKNIYLVLDKDALKFTIKYAEKFMKDGFTVYLVDLSGKDPSSLGFEKTQRLIQQATPLTFKQLVQLRLTI